MSNPLPILTIHPLLNLNTPNVLKRTVLNYGNKPNGPVVKLSILTSRNVKLKVITGYVITTVRITSMLCRILLEKELALEVNLVVSAD